MIMKLFYEFSSVSLESIWNSSKGALVKKKNQKLIFFKLIEKDDEWKLWNWLHDWYRKQMPWSHVMFWAYFVWVKRTILCHKTRSSNVTGYFLEGCQVGRERCYSLQKVYSNIFLATKIGDLIEYKIAINSLSDFPELVKNKMKDLLSFPARWLRFYQLAEQLQQNCV